ncbi:MAG: hypothetical protein ABSH41_14455 [Syntrophobacteraceae bacterium]|jgi:hypothetical protein
MRHIWFVFKILSLCFVAAALSGAVLAVLFVGYMSWVYHLPSDKKAEAFFYAHRQELTEIIAVFQREPNMRMVFAQGWHGPDTAEPAHEACAKLLRKIGASYARTERHKGGSLAGGIEIFVWGYKGYVFIPLETQMQGYTTVLSLEDEKLPKVHNSKRAIEDGRYIRPLVEGWYLLRWEYK